MRARRERIERKSVEQLRLMRQAGLVVARALGEMHDAVAPGVSTADLDAIARDVLRDAGAQSSFLGYDVGTGPYPAVICASVNDRVVHGIPSRAERLAEGDLVSLDFGAIVEGWHGDAAITVGVGELDPPVRDLSDACERALWSGIAAASAGGRLGDISSAVERTVRAAAGPAPSRASGDGSGDAGRYGSRYGIVAGYGGHGIGSRMHMDPHVLNYGPAGKGPRLLPGMALAIEPMLTLGSPQTREHDDGWTISTVDGSRAAHWEHTVAILEDGLWVLTAADGGRAELAERGVALSALAG